MINTLVVKFASPCNLACSYCYEYFHGDDSWKTKPKRISLEVITEIALKLRFYLKKKKLNNFNFIAHGGEPLLVGPKYFNQIYEILANILDLKRVNFYLQTNGTLITKDFIELFEKFNIKVGVSLDGDLASNNLRLDHQGKESWHRAVNGLNLLKKNSKKLFSGILCVPNFDSDPLSILKSFYDLDVENVDVLLPFYTHDSLDEVEKKIIQKKSKIWFENLFNIWSKNKKYHYIKIRIFEDAMQSIFTKNCNTDWFGHKSVSYLVVLTDGNVDVLDHLKVIGKFSQEVRSLNKSIFDNSIEDIVKITSSKIKELNINSLPTDCNSCKWKNHCLGGYIPHRYSSTKLFNNKSFYCETIYNIFNLSQKFLNNFNVRL